MGAGEIDAVEESLDNVAKLAVGMRQRYEDKGIGQDVREDFLVEVRRVDERLLDLLELLEEFHG